MFTSSTRYDDSIQHPQGRRLDHVSIKYMPNKAAPSATEIMDFEAACALLPTGLRLTTSTTIRSTVSFLSFFSCQLFSCKSSRRTA